MLQRLSIRGKLLAVVAVPTLVLLLATAIVVWNAATSFTAARNVAQLVRVVDNSTPLIDDLEAERTAVSGYLRSVTDGDAKRVTARTAVRTTVAALVNAGEDDPSWKPYADAIAAAVNGTVGDPGLDQARTVANVTSTPGEFPSWPSADDVSASLTIFDVVATKVETAIKGAPVNDLGTKARELPDLIRVEGNALSTYLNESRQFVEQLPEVFTSTDGTASRFAGVANGIGGGSVNAPVAGYAEDAMSGVDDVKALRDRVRSGAVQPGAAEDVYTATLDSLLSMTREISNVVSDRELASHLTAYVDMQDLVEEVRLEEVYVDRKIRQGYWVSGEEAQFQALYFGSNNALDIARQSVSLLPDIPAVPEFGASYDARSRIGYETIRDRLFRDPTAQALEDQRTAEWSLQVDEEIDVYGPILDDLKSAVTSRSSSLERASLIQTIAIIAAAIIVVVASQLVAQSIARRIVNPLRRLTTTATAVRQELPRLVERVAMPGQSVDVSEVQIPVESADEVGRLAEAFNSVNAATLSIAAEQAALRGSISEMFVNVARRDQVLLNRQLASIDEMERTQDDPETLTKLFALDHLATRMRRNSESLLVLAGIDTGRRLRRPMPLSDVIRTASSEIELYERVQLELDADPAMLGHSALTAAHLFAELLENATVFSDPGTPVVVRTMERDGAIVVTITDSGIGMTPEELSEANSRVASTAASEILGAQRLGLFVVGRIARRVGARVHLDSIESQGTVATIVMPPSLFDASVAPVASGHVSSSVADDDMHAPSALVAHEELEEEQQAPTPARGSAYQPTAIEEGSVLLGRDAPPSDVLPVRTPVPEPAPLSDEVSSLVAADAADAPEAVPVDLDALTEGASPAGLPTRRRRASSGPEAPKDTSSIIGLPQRASDEQLTALASAATSGFTPILAADEVSPESAEQRARVFRGFRPMRGGEDEPSSLAPDAESLGHAMRREALAGPGDVQDDGPFAPIAEAAPADAAPALAPEPAPLTEPVPAREAQYQAPQEAAGEPEQVSGPAAALEPEAQPDATPTQDAAIASADARDAEAPVVTQSPLIARGFDPTDVSGDAGPAAAAFSVPMLEEDEEPVAPAPVAQREATPSAGVEQVSLDEGGPLYSSPLYPVESTPQWRTVPGIPTVQRPQTQPWAQAHQAAPAAEPVAEAPAPQPAQQWPPAAQPEAEQYGQQPAWPGQEPAAPAQQWPPAAPAQPQQSALPAFEPDPVTSTPSLDDLIYAGPQGDGDDKAGFFGRLFGGKGARRDEAPAPSAPEHGAGFSPVTGQTPVVPTPTGQTPALPQAARAPIFPPSGAVPQAPQYEAYPAAPQQDAYPAAPLGGAAPWAAAAQREPAPQAPEAPAPAPAPQAQEWGGFAPAPQAPSNAFEPQAFEPAPGQPLSQDSGWPYQQATPAGVAPQAGAPEQAWNAPQDEWGPAEEYRQFGGHDTYSPDQLARPLGWEAAGESALQAAAPEVATEYRPLVQIDPEPLADSGDFASDAFSELSSLAAERPKVEKTRAGLVKRTPVERAATPEPEAASAVPAEPRDADAIRKRFSAFYSGTKRARDDVQSFNDSTQGSLTDS